MIAGVISFYGSEADLQDCLSKLLDGKTYRQLSDSCTLPIDIIRPIKPLGSIVFNVSIANHDHKNDSEHLLLSVSASRKGLIPNPMMYRHITNLEQDLISVVTTVTPKKTALSSRKILQIVMDKTVVTEEQTLQLLDNINTNPTVTEADTFFKINDILKNPKPAYWQDSFISGLFQYYTSQHHGTDHMELIKHIKKDGKVDEATELRLLMLINRKFEGAGDELQDAILEEVHQSVLHSSDSQFIDTNRVEGAVDAEDIVLLRRTIFGAGSDGGIGISRREADLLFRVDIDTAKAENHQDWPEFFAYAMRSYLLSAGEIINVIGEDERVWLLSNIQRYDRKTDGINRLYELLVEDNIYLPESVVQAMVS